MDAVTLRVKPRSTRGKGAARQLRMNGRLPAVVYGQGAAAQALELSPKDLQAALRTEHRRNVLVRLDTGEQQELAMIKELQRHPVDRNPLHVDFYRVSETVPVDVKVPLTTRGRAKGVVRGGELAKLFRELPVRTVPGKIPSAIEVDVTDLDIHQSVQVKDLPLAEGVQVVLNPERSVIAIGGERKKRGEEAAEAEGGEDDKDAKGSNPPPTK